jgi:hypothetical protein
MVITHEDRRNPNWGLRILIAVAAVIAIAASVAVYAAFGGNDNNDTPAATSNDWPASPQPENDEPVIDPTTEPTPSPTPSATPTETEEPETDASAVATQSYEPAPYPTVRPTTNLPRPGTAGANDGLMITVKGHCNDKGGLRLDGKGFTPGGTYLTQAWYPVSQKSRQYTHLQDNGLGVADDKGHTPNWRWDCNDGEKGKPDPRGVYTLMMVDYGPDNAGPYRWAYTTFTVD